LVELIRGRRIEQFPVEFAIADARDRATRGIESETVEFVFEEVALGARTGLRRRGRARRQPEGFVTEGREIAREKHCPSVAQRLRQESRATAIHQPGDRLCRENEIRPRMGEGIDDGEFAVAGGGYLRRQRSERATGQTLGIRQ